MSFLSDYLAFTQNQEATDRVHRWVGLSVIAGALERKVWLYRGSYTLFPNLYTFIVGPSGVVRKSTSTAIGVDMLRELPTVKIMSEKCTASSLIHQFARSQKTFSYAGREVKQSATFAYASELHVFLDEVFGSLTELLTTFYDCIPQDSSKPWIYETIANGMTQIYGPCLNILGASTPSWLIKSIPPAEMEGGFASRVIFVVEDSAKRSIAWPELEITPDDHEALKRRLSADLRRINELVGPMKPCKNLRREGQLWYESHQKAQKANTDSRFSGYYGRKFDTVLKVAMLLSASEDSSLDLLLRHFEEALVLLQDVETRMFNAFGGHGENPDGLLIEKVWRIIAEEKKIAFSKLLTKIRRDANHERMCGVIDSLMAMQRINKYRDDIAKEIFFSAVDPERPL